LNSISSGARFAITTLLILCAQHAMAAESVAVVVAEKPMSSPFGVDFDAAGNMWVVELYGGRVFAKHAGGSLRHVSGDGGKSYKGDGGPMSAATFNGMHNVAVSPAGDVYISDSWNHCIRRIDAKTKTVSTFAGDGKPGFSGDGGSAEKARFNFLMCVTADPEFKHLYIADLKNRRIRAIDLATGIVRTVAGNGKRGVPEDGAVAVDSPLVDPRAVAADSQGNVYILERGGHALRVVGADGKIRTVAGDGTPGDRDGAALKSQFKSPKHICIDPLDQVIIADEANRKIRVYHPSTATVTTLLGGANTPPPVKQMSQPHGVCYEKGELFIVDTGNNRILKMPYKASQK